METKVNKCKQTAIIFCRCSSSGYLANRQDTSRQVADLKAYADYANLKVVKVFEEHLSGGKKNYERPILNEAIEFCKQEKISFCLVNSLDRIGRNAFEVLATVKELIDNGINLYMQNIVDTQNQPANYQIYIIKIFMDASYSNPLFNDPDKELVLSYYSDGNSLTRFSLDTDWRRAIIAASMQLKKLQ